MEDPTKNAIPGEDSMYGRGLAGVEYSPYPSSKPIFKDARAAGTGTQPLVEVTVKSEGVMVLGPVGEVLSSIPGRVERRFVYQTDVDENTMDQVVREVKKDVGKGHEHAVSLAFESVCFFCGNDPCFVFDYLCRMGEIARTMKVRSKTNGEIRCKIYRYLSTQLCMGTGHGSLHGLPECLFSIVQDAFPNENGEPSVLLLGVNSK